MLVLLLTLCSPGQAAEQVGYVAAVRSQAQLLRHDQAPRTPTVGAAISMHDRFQTGANGRIDLVFRDGSSITIGPNSKLTLDRFVFDPDQDKGELAVTVMKGLFRFIGGRISKKHPVKFRAPNATIGIRGGMALLEVEGQEFADRTSPEPPAQLNATFLYGITLTVNTDQDRQQMTRPGFLLSTRNDGRIGKPVRAEQSALDRLAKALQ